MEKYTERNNQWLENLMYSIWEEYFNDIPRKNYVLIKFGKRAKRQLGSIKWVRGRTKVKGLLKDRVEEVQSQDDTRITVITITSLFKGKSVPKYVVVSTIAHEMVHYAHGFFSPLKQIYNHPHQGGVIGKELEERGLGGIHRKSRKWLKEKWYR